MIQFLTNPSDCGLWRDPSGADLTSGINSVDPSAERDRAAVVRAVSSSV